MLADPEALKRALANLIDNAAEAMQSSLLRELTIETGVIEGHTMAEIVIADTGHGLNDEMRERLFLPYFSTKQRGTGLGLAIAAKIVQEHTGPFARNRTVLTERDSSSNCRWPMQKRARSGSGGANGRTDVMNHVLIVDDESEIRESLGEILKEDGYAVTSTATASEAMVLLRDASYDVMLLDIWLPDRDGLEVLTEIRSLDIESTPEVIIISGHGTIETAVRATKLGAFDFLEKPLSIDRTLILLKNAVRSAAAAQREPGVQAPAADARADHWRERLHQGAAPADQAHGAHQRTGARSMANPVPARS